MDARSFSLAILCAALAALVFSTTHAANVTVAPLTATLPPILLVDRPVTPAPPTNVTTPTPPPVTTNAPTPTSTAASATRAPPATDPPGAPQKSEDDTFDWPWWGLTIAALVLIVCIGIVFSGFRRLEAHDAAEMEEEEEQKEAAAAERRGNVNVRYDPDGEERLPFGRTKQRKQTKQSKFTGSRSASPIEDGDQSGSRTSDVPSSADGAPEEVLPASSPTDPMTSRRRTNDVALQEHRVPTREPFAVAIAANCHGDATHSPPPRHPTGIQPRPYRVVRPPSAAAAAHAVPRVVVGATQQPQQSTGPPNVQRHVVVRTTMPDRRVVHTM